jgi:predicted nucleotidyltransferase
MNMKSCGIIVEYNPFHNGHLYHAQRARELSQAEVVIAVMSGNFLQRGEPAIVDKWTRAKAALLHGVDLVIELPFAYSVQSADYFAKGGIKLLQALACDAVCFGTDQSTAFDYAAFGSFVKDNQASIDQAYQRIKNNGMSYPQQMTAVFRQLYSEIGLDFSTPNHILGLSYAKENAAYERPMTLYPLAREQAGYHDATIYPQFASATAIRQAIGDNQFKKIAPVLPTWMFETLQQTPNVTWENYWPLLKYKLLSTSPIELQRIYQMKEGIEYRLQEAAKTADSFQSFITLAKTKRYTWTRLQRLAVYLLNNVTQAEIKAVWSNSYLQVLGFTEKGKQYLREHKKTITLPIIAKVSKEVGQQMALAIRADRLYQLGAPEINEQNFGRFPLRES